VVSPAVNFEVRLPLHNWTQRYLQTGCGGLCGFLHIDIQQGEGCMPAQHGELALASSDMGHTGGFDATWGASNYAARIDFAYRGMHVTALAAKALITAYYGRPAKYSYFAGCSDGGREALMEAQRYPQDFNGVTAGAPAMNFTTQNTFYHGWNARVNTDAAGHAILTADKLPLLHAAVLEQCDATDGLKDGLIGDPIHCHPELSSLECKPGQDPAGCLSAEQIQVAREIYRGAHDAQGRQLVIGGPLPGSELNWRGVYVQPPGQDRSMSGMIALGTIKYLTTDPNPPADFTLQQFQFTAPNFKATTQLHGLYDATDPDLSAFVTAGGKLILWHGLADPHISPLNTIAYYQALQRQLGIDKVNRFTRMFLFPGGDHCAGGEGPFEVDILSAIMDWVEHGQAPQLLIARDRAGRTRPVYTFPQVAKYTGHGDVSDAANFVPAAPAKPWPTQFAWLGGEFYRPGQTLWCTAQNATFDCTTRNR
jgi:feruloyl esterase